MYIFIFSKDNQNRFCILLQRALLKTDGIRIFLMQRFQEFLPRTYSQSRIHSILHHDLQALNLYTTQEHKNQKGERICELHIDEHGGHIYRKEILLWNEDSPNPGGPNNIPFSCWSRTFAFPKVRVTVTFSLMRMNAFYFLLRCIFKNTFPPNPFFFQEKKLQVVL